MAYPSTKKYNYWGQFGIFVCFIGAGLVLGEAIALTPIIAKTGTSIFSPNFEAILDKLFVPENVKVLRLMQFISTFFLFFLPTVLYAHICHSKAFTHLGYKQSINIKQIGLAVLVMLFCLPLVAALSEFTEMLPFSKATLEKFRLAEEKYDKQINIIGRMTTFIDYLISLLMLALLPALFEETLFRGGIQNLLSRWIKLPILAIIITSAVFSAVHGSYIGFLSRFVLSFILGWMYYRTGNLWLSIIGHVFNNVFALTVLYVMRLKNPNIDLSKADPEFPMWTGLVSILAVYGLLILFEQVNKHQINQPGKEVLMHTENKSRSSWINNSNETKHGI